MVKKQYATPVVRSHGSMTTVTRQNRSGANLDAGFQAGTPLDQVTLS